MNLRCLKHPEYKGKTSPILSCRVCCSMYLADMRERQVSEDAVKLPPLPPIATRKDERDAVIQAVLQNI